jgi:hypothetical protein
MDMELDTEDLLEDVDVNFDKSGIKLLMELAMRMADSVRATSEWHRQNGQKIRYETLIPGAKVYFYKPPSQSETKARGRKAKHLEHYIGPATVVRQVRSRSFIIQYTDKKGVSRIYQRDTAMLSLVPPSKVINDPAECSATIKSPHNHYSIVKDPIEEGEIVILKDGSDANTWYCAQVLKKLPDYVKVSYFTTETLALANYVGTTLKERLRSLEEVVFRKTWSLMDGRATTVAPANSKQRSLLWTEKIPTDFLDEQLLVRNVGLSSQGKLDDTTVNLVAKLKVTSSRWSVM